MGFSGKTQHILSEMGTGTNDGMVEVEEALEEASITFNCSSITT